MAFLVRGALRDVLRESLGSEHVMIISKLDKPMLDVKLSDKVGLENTRVRSILNELHEKRLVGLKRTKGPKEGWFSYYWNRREEDILNYVASYLEGKLCMLSGMVNTSADDIVYSCGCSTVSYGKAIEEGFRCGECNQDFTNYKSQKELREINAEIKRLSELKKKTLSLT